MTDPDPHSQDADAPLPDWTTHALFIDFDGTLAAIAARPEDVRLTAETRRLLERLVTATDGAVAVLSGRALDSLASEVEGLPLALAGSHGLELRLADGRRLDAPGGDQKALDAVHAALLPHAGAADLRLERKPGAVALHYRNRPDLAERCRDRVADAAAAQGLRVMHGHMVSEAALAGIDKGSALRRLLADPPFRGRTPIAIGDDTTDEDAFRAAQALGGFGLRIGAAETVTRLRVARRDDALAWLEKTLADPAAPR